MYGNTLNLWALSVELAYYHHFGAYNIELEPITLRMSVQAYPGLKTTFCAKYPSVCVLSVS